MSSEAKLVGALFPADVRVAEMNPSEARLTALPEAEQQVVHKAVDKRQREFAAGRTLARRLMRELGVPADFALLPGEDRAPRWPDGVVGSITHTEGWAAVVVASAGRIQSVGCDVEQGGPLKSELWKAVCTEREIAWLADQPEAARGELAKVIFSAKECFYKTQYPQTQQFLGFQAVDVVPRAVAGRFDVHLHREAGRFRPGMRFEGRYLAKRGLVATGMVMNERDGG